MYTEPCEQHTDNEVEYIWALGKLFSLNSSYYLFRKEPFILTILI